MAAQDCLGLGGQRKTLVIAARWNAAGDARMAELYVGSTTPLRGGRRQIYDWDNLCYEPVRFDAARDPLIEWE